MPRYTSITMRRRIILAAIMAVAALTMILHEVVAMEAAATIPVPSVAAVRVITAIPVPPEPASWKFQVRESLCDDPNQKRSRWTHKHAKETRNRIRWACRGLGNSKRICDYWDIVVVRESGGQASAAHTQGVGELGYGAMALSEKWHGGKWSGRASTDFCVPENTAVVMHEIMWRAIAHYPTRNLSDVQAVFGGHMEGSGKGRVPSTYWKHRTKFCLRLVEQRRGWGCSTRVSVKELGWRIPKSQRRAVAAKLKARNDKRL